MFEDTPNELSVSLPAGLHCKQRVYCVYGYWIQVPFPSRTTNTEYYKMNRTPVVVKQ